MPSKNLYRKCVICTLNATFSRLSSRTFIYFSRGYDLRVNDKIATSERISPHCIVQQSTFILKAESHDKRRNISTYIGKFTNFKVPAFIKWSLKIMIFLSFFQPFYPFHHGIEYGISANSFRGNYSFLNFENLENLI